MIRNIGIPETDRPAPIAGRGSRGAASPAGASLIAAIGLMTAAWPSGAVAQGYPAKPIRLVVPFPAGGALDRLSRAIAPRAAETFGQPVLVENRPGAGTALGVEAVARSLPDGHTGLMSGAALVILPLIRQKLPFNVERDLVPVSLIANTPNVLVSNPALPVRSVKELVALARSRPGELTYASIGTGTPQHLSGELLKVNAKLDIVHIPYQGGAPAAAALLGGHVSFMFVNLAEVTAFIDGGRMRLLAVATADRLPDRRNVPTMTEAGVPGFDSTSWFGMLMPTGVSREIIARWQAEIVRVLQLSDVRETLAATGLRPLGTTPEQFGSLMQAESARFARVIREAKVAVE